MTIGNPTTNSAGQSNGQKGLKFVCLQNKSTRFPELDTFPTQPCQAGIMTVHHFPSFVAFSLVTTIPFSSSMYANHRGLMLTCLYVLDAGMART